MPRRGQYLTALFEDFPKDDSLKKIQTRISKANLQRKCLFFLLMLLSYLEYDF